MRKQLLQALVLLVISFSLLVMGFNTGKTIPYENMVNAVVVIRDNNGFGSGVFIDDNVILTAAHVLEGQSFEVKLSDGTLLKTNDFYVDNKEDVGFIFVEADELSIAKVSATPRKIGDTVYLVGAQYVPVYEFTMTKGIISHLDRDIPELDWENLLQSDVAGGPGCSGGPLYDSDGNVIGMYVGQFGGGGLGISLFESAESILEAYERYKNASN